MTTTQAEPTLTPLPEQFSDLARFVPMWCLPSQAQRYPVMISASMSELEDFSHAMMARLDAVLDYLDALDIHGLAPQDQRLLDLATTFAEVSHPVDLQWTEANAADIFPFERVDLAEPCTTW